MRISLIVPAYNEENYLGECLEALRTARAALPEEWETEVIVVDNNSTDATAEKAAQAGARVVFEPCNQIARARNAGAKAATGDWLLFVDADSRPSAGLFAALIGRIRQGGCAGGGVVVEMDDCPRWAKALTAFWNLVSRVCRWAAGSFLFCRADLFREVGGFDETLFVSEEIDLSKRLKQAARKHGLRFVVLPGPPLITSGRKTKLYGPKEIARTFWRLARRPRRSVRDRAACGFWYDGRR